MQGFVCQNNDARDSYKPNLLKDDEGPPRNPTIIGFGLTIAQQDSTNVHP
jgi:hypothetical protein